MDYHEWELTVYPKLFNNAKQIGRKAKESGLPRICNLPNEFRTPNGDILRVWLSAWEQGYDNYNPIPECFKQVEAILNFVPTKELKA